MTNYTRPKSTYIDVPLVDRNSMSNENHNNRPRYHPNHQQQPRQVQFRQPLHSVARQNPPFFIVFISIFELCTFLYYALRSEEPISLTGPVPFSSKLIYSPYRRYEIWRFITYTLIHAGYWHLSFNLLTQLFVGIPLEVVHDSKPIFIIYFGGVVGGSLGHSISDPHTYLAGASAGCFALIAAHLADLIMNWSQMSEERPGAKLFALVGFAVVDVVLSVYERHFKNESFAWKTSYAGHLSGALSGFLLGLVYLQRTKPIAWQDKVSQTALIIYVALVVMAISINVFDRDYFPLPDKRDTPWYQNPFTRSRE